MHTGHHDGNRRGFLRPDRAGGIYSAKAGKDTFFKERFLTIVKWGEKGL
ncbi:hypothetical protein CLOSTASPAR_02424 [[Clostridium] asparagiforme DSM 15981]|uniref:Uncharacterized protein n=1 Tax=[Clostridium] asparagiforme DSM 15981 TaxID=518636 RepID=C0CZJ7_9FIRM|nr:hypothetical protein CLOSTASPAR_02424 [[Clostridium] asparagiforme DSM 15981]